MPGSADAMDAVDDEPGVGTGAMEGGRDALGDDLEGRKAKREGKEGRVGTARDGTTKGIRAEPEGEQWTLHISISFPPSKSGSPSPFKRFKALFSLLVGGGDGTLEANVAREEVMNGTCTAQRAE